MIRNNLLTKHYTIFSIWSPSRITIIHERLLEEFRSIKENNSFTIDFTTYLSIKFISMVLRISMEDASNLSAQKSAMCLHKITQILREHGKC